MQAVICHQRKTLSIIEIWTPILSKLVKFLRLMLSYFYRGLALGEVFGNSKSSEELFRQKCHLEMSESADDDENVKDLVRLF